MLKTATRAVSLAFVICGLILLYIRDDGAMTVSLAVLPGLDSASVSRLSASQELSVLAQVVGGGSPSIAFAEPGVGLAACDQGWAGQGSWWGSCPETGSSYLGDSAGTRLSDLEIRRGDWPWPYDGDPKRLTAAARLLEPGDWTDWIPAGPEAGQSGDSAGHCRVYRIEKDYYYLTPLYSGDSPPHVPWPAPSWVEKEPPSTDFFFRHLVDVSAASAESETEPIPAVEGPRFVVLVDFLLQSVMQAYGEATDEEGLARSLNDEALRVVDKRLSNQLLTMGGRFCQVVIGGTAASPLLWTNCPGEQCRPSADGSPWLRACLQARLGFDPGARNVAAGDSLTVAASAQIEPAVEDETYVTLSAEVLVSQLVSDPQP
ncbi:MAG: hypothetical protein ABGY28_08430 [bacterium]